MNMIQMMQQAQKMQKRLKEVQDELANSEVTAKSNGGAVEVTMNGQIKFKKIKLTKAAINPENPDSVDDETVEMLEDLITQAMINATSEAAALMENKMKSVTGGISIPGLFRSEEHTSELQSRFDLVCRLLLEKKKITTSLIVHEHYITNISQIYPSAI